MGLSTLARPELRGSFGMVASTHWLASQAGMSVLERGGNAFDAAAAAGLVLHVVEPHLNGIGGDVPLMAWDASAARPFVLCGQGTAPATATVAHFADLGLEAIPGSGLLPACVPGAFGTWIRLVRDYGTWHLGDILSFAIHYARSGFACLPKISETIKSVHRLMLDEWPTSAELWLSHSRVPETGTLLRNLALANTLERVIHIATQGGGTREEQLDRAYDAFYRGFVAEKIDQYYANTPVLDSSGRRHTGLLSAADMAAWEPTYEKPVELDYHGYTILKCGPWTQGPVFLQQLALLKGWDLSALETTSSDFIHVVTECAKLSFADREAHYGDPDFTEVAIDRFLTEEYNRSRRALVADTAYVGDQRPGSPDGRPIPPLRAASATAGEAQGLGEPTFGDVDESRGDTCHVDIVDRWGNMVAATPSGGWLQSSPAVSELGFALGTRGQMFSLDEEHPNGLSPRKRPRTTLSPSLALRGSDPYLAFGTPGGDTQDQCSLVFLLRHLHHNRNLQQAIEDPAFFTDDFPSSFFPYERTPGGLTIENRVPATTVGDLRERGHNLHLADPWSIGRLSAVARTSDGELRAAANPRGAQGYAVGR